MKIYTSQENIAKLKHTFAKYSIACKILPLPACTCTLDVQLDFDNHDKDPKPKINEYGVEDW